MYWFFRFLRYRKCDFEYSSLWFFQFIKWWFFCGYFDDGVVQRLNVCSFFVIFGFLVYDFWCYVLKGIWKYVNIVLFEKEKIDGY